MTPIDNQPGPARSARPETDQPLRFALVRFDGADTAAARFASACARRGGVPWLREVGVVERHRDGHLVLRGSFAGRYVDFDEADHVSEPGAERGAVIGGILGTILGPPGIAVGLVLGGAVGSQTGKPTEVESKPESLAAGLRESLAPGTSALAIVAGPQDVTEMLAALGSEAAEVTQRSLDADGRAALVAEIDAARTVPVPRA